ncbi:MAG: phosphoserine transaminase [Pseudomonadota bacterium]
MQSSQKPQAAPRSPFFSSGPCAKRPGWTLDTLNDACLARSHRSKPGKAKLKQVIDMTRDILGVPDDYHIGIVPASDTGAVEMAMWSMLGARGVDMLAWESFSSDWVTDVVKQLKLDANVIKSDYGQLPDLSQVNPANDCVFVWNGTTSGVRVPNADWISDDREGITICDATSAAFAMELPWSKLDVTTYSWQKVLGGEAQHGMIVLSPRAVERLENYTPPWPLPKIFRMTKAGKLNAGIFKGETINTPSMLAVEDQIDALTWAKSIGGLKGLVDRAEQSLKIVSDWVEASDSFDFLATDPATRSCTSICLKIIDPWFASLSDEDQAAVAKQIATTLEAEGVAYDIAGYRAAPPGLRLWGGATVEPSDMQALLPWLDWALASIRETRAAA